MLTHAQLRLLAARRVARGEQLTRDHVLDGTGCCRRCGRTHPCDGQRLGRALVAYYRPLTTGAAPRPPATPVVTNPLSPRTEVERPTPPERLYLVRARGRLSRWLVRHAPR